MTFSILGLTPEEGAELIILCQRYARQPRESHDEETKSRSDYKRWVTLLEKHNKAVSTHIEKAFARVDERRKMILN
jgi:hypothetical protein